MKTPNARQQANRRRLAVIAAVLGLALVSGAIGLLSHPSGDVMAKATTGPFSYFPSE
jgi:hypothetical protein